MHLTEEELQENGDLAKELRKRFIEELEEPCDIYHEADIQRVKDDDWYCTRFILHKKGDVDASLVMLKDSLLWRKEFDVHSINEESIPVEFFKAGAVFPYNTDKDGNSVLILQCRMHHKSPDLAHDLRCFLVYWIEKIQKETNGGAITVIMDCMNTGLSNLDMELIKFLITLFKCYYPYTLGYILIFEMPWLFNAAWKIVKSWLPEDAVEKIKFVNKTSIFDYVEKEKLPVCMGGMDKHVYVYEPKNGLTGGLDCDRMVGPKKKRVHFEACDANSSEQNHKILLQSSIKRGSSHKINSNSSGLDSFVLGGIIKINPPLDLVFPTQTDLCQEVTIALTNIVDNPVAYKVKTNNLESYRVRPPTGLIQPSQTVEISVYLTHGHQCQQTDKFLIMVMELEKNFSISELSQRWRTCVKDHIVEHKLRCVMDNSSDELDDGTQLQDSIDAVHLGTIVTDINSRLARLEVLQDAGNHNQNIAFYLLCLLLLLSIFHLAEVNFSVFSLSSSCSSDSQSS